MRYFNRVSLSTPESVELEFTLAGIGSRTLALTIDYSILILGILAFWIVWFVVSIGLLSSLESFGRDYSSAPLWLLAIFILLNFAVWNGYFILFETIWQGQTPGKRWVKIRVVRDDGRPVGMAQSTLRSLLRAIDDFCFIGALFILFSKREKRIGDWVAGTLVIQEIQGNQQATVILSENAKTLAAQLPDVADLNQLLPDDYAVIRDYLGRRTRMTPQARTEKSMELARQLRALLAMETIPPNTTSDDFLEAVFMAYQQMSDRGL
jgi:uncharacterized RDD family membrane protein YckC